MAGFARKRISFVAIGMMYFLISVSCRAEMQPPPFAPVTPEPWVPQDQNLLRLNVGISFYNSGWYYCNYYSPYYGCTSGAYGSFTPFTLGLQGDIHIDGMSYLTPGFQVLTGSITNSYFNSVTTVSQSTHMTLWSPTLDYVAKFGSPSSDTVTRGRVGGVLYFGSDGHSGGGFRVGFGGSFFSSRRIGLGLDIVFEGGSYNGYWLSGIQLLVSPELHF